MVFVATKQCGDNCFVAFVSILQGKEYHDLTLQTGDKIAIGDIEIDIGITQTELHLKWAPI